MQQTPLYTTELEYTLEECRRFTFTIQKRSIAPYYFAFLIVLLSVMEYMVVGNLVDVLGIIVATVVFSALLYYYLLKWTVKRSFKAEAQRMGRRRKMRIDFFADHLLYTVSYDRDAVPYSEVRKVIETPTNLYIMFGRRNGLIVSKEGADEDALDFIRKL